jgi:hypothetical protein
MLSATEEILVTAHRNKLFLTPNASRVDSAPLLLSSQKTLQGAHPQHKTTSMSRQNGRRCPFCSKGSSENSPTSGTPRTLPQATTREGGPKSQCMGCAHGTPASKTGIRISSQMGEQPPAGHAGTLANLLLNKIKFTAWGGRCWGWALQRGLPQ